MKDAAIPDDIVALSEAFCGELTALISRTVDQSLSTLEEGVHEVLRRLAPAALTIVVQRTQRSLGPARRDALAPCPHCATPTRIQSRRTRTFLTTCGKVTFPRPWYHCRQCQQGFSPTERTLATGPRQRLSPRLRTQVTTLGAMTSFAEAADVLEELTGTMLPPETVRRVTEAEGAAVEEATQAAIQRVAAGHEHPVRVAPQAGRLVVETDGVMAPYRDGWHEIKVGLAGWYADGRLLAPSYTAVRASAAAFGPRLLAEAARRGALDIVGWTGGVRERGLASLRPVTVVGDGAHWIWDLAAAHFGERTEVVDWFHASHHVWAVAKAVQPEATAAAWAEARLQELWEADVPTMLRRFAWVQPPTPEAAEVLRRERQYFLTNTTRMCYAALRRTGQPIGSGAAESSAKHLIQQRLKRAGARWQEPGAQAIIALRCQRASRLADAA